MCGDRMSNYEYSLESFLEFEKQEKLFHRKYRNVFYWQSLRVEISRILANTYTENFKNQSIKKVKKQSHILDLIKHRNGTRKLKECDILYFCEQLYRKIGNDYFDPYFDFFEFEEKYTIVTCNYIFSRRNSDVKDKPNSFGTALPDFIYEVLFFLFKSFKIDKDEENYLLKFAEVINNKYDAKIEGEWLIRRVKDIYFTHLVYEMYYCRILEKLRPKVIFLDCYYNTLSLFPLYVVAKRKGIPVIEYMHGNLCNVEAYTYYDTTEIGKELPDYFFSYGSFWRNYIKMPDIVKVRDIGNPFLEKRKNELKDVARIENSIVFYSKETLEVMIEFLKDEFSKDYIICYKPHPLDGDEYLKRLDEFKNARVKIYSKDMEVYKILQKNRYHVSTCSTVLFEGIEFGAESFVHWKKEYRQYMSPLVEEGYASGFSTIDELKALLSCKEEEKHHILVDNIWKENAKQNAYNEVQSIIREVT